MASENRSGEHRHSCPLCGVDARCAVASHRVGHAPKIRMSGEREPSQSFKLCGKCARRESKGMKESVGGDVAILAQLIERGLPGLNAVDVLAEALLTRQRTHAGVALDGVARESARIEAAANQILGMLYGRTKAEARRLALLAYLEASPGERDVARKVMRRYPKAGFPSADAVKQAAYRLCLKLGLRRKAVR